MARGKKNKRAGARAAAPVSQPTVGESDGRPPLAPLLGIVALLAITGVLAFLLFGGDSSDEETSAGSSEDAELAVPWIDPDRQPPAVSAVDTNPADDSLWLGTNTGLFRVPPEGGEPEKMAGTLSTRQFGEARSRRSSRFASRARTGSSHRGTRRRIPRCRQCWV